MILSLLPRCSHLEGAVAVATLFSGASAFSCPSPLAGARQSRHTTMAAAGPGARGESAELPTSRKDVLGAVFGAVGVSSFAFVAAADAKVGVTVCMCACTCDTFTVVSHGNLYVCGTCLSRFTARMDR